MPIEDKSDFSNFLDYEVKPQPTPPNVKAKQFDHEFVCKCGDKILHGKPGDYLIDTGGAKMVMNQQDFETRFQLIGGE